FRVERVSVLSEAHSLATPTLALRAAGSLPRDVLACLAAPSCATLLHCIPPVNGKTHRSDGSVGQARTSPTWAWIPAGRRAIRARPGRRAGAARSRALAAPDAA